MIHRIRRGLLRRGQEALVKSSAVFLNGPAAPLAQPDLAHAKAELQSVYNRYVHEVSRADMAASLELSAFLFAWCRLKRPNRLLDLGSGFTSYVFRLHAAQNPGVQVCSVDDDAQWLDRTRAFVGGYGVATEGMITLSELPDSTDGFDLVVQDLNFVEVRVQHTEKAVHLTKKGGLVIFDDVHKADYRGALLHQLRHQPVTVYSLQHFTQDAYQRYAYAGVRKT